MNTELTVVKRAMQGTDLKEGSSGAQKRGEPAENTSEGSKEKRARPESGSSTEGKATLQPWEAQWKV